jgi:hypothetical protein
MSGLRDERIPQGMAADLLPQRRGGALGDDPAVVDDRIWSATRSASCSSTSRLPGSTPRPETRSGNSSASCAATST